MAKAKKSKAKGKADATDDPSSGKSGKGGLLGQLALMVTLGAASFATVFFLPTKPVMQSAPEHEIHDKKAEQIVDFAPTLSFIDLSPLTISLDGGNGLLKIGITLEVLEESQESVDPNNPQIRDAFTSYLRALRPEQIRDAAFMVQLRAQLLHRARLVFGREDIQGVLITDFLVQ